MTVVDQAAGLEYDFYGASAPRHGEIVVAAGSSIPVGANSGTGLGGAAEAAYLGLLGGLIRAPELAAGRIEHAIAIYVPCEQVHDVWPAPANGTGDSICPNGAGPHLGSLLQLNMSEREINASHAPSWQRALMRAMARYGMYVVDSGHSMGWMVEDDESFTSFGYPGQMHQFIGGGKGRSELVGVPLNLSKLRVIDPCVPQRRC